MARRSDPWPALILVSLLALAGCFGGSDDDTDPTGDPTPTPTDDPADEVTFTVSITNFTAAVAVGAQVPVEWAVEGGPSDNMTRTGVAFGNDSVAMPLAAEDYDNVSEAEPGPVPGNFTAAFPAAQAGMIYARAFAVVEGDHHWSEEILVEVVEAVIVEVTIGGGLQGVGPLSQYAPDPVTVQVGEAIVWTNNDQIAHTATATDDSFNTGNIAAGASSDPILFTEPGEYAYLCGLHPATMSGTVVVEAA